MDIVRVPPVGARRMPFAIGVLRPPLPPGGHRAENGSHGADDSGRDDAEARAEAVVARSAARVAVALIAGEAGFCLLDVVQIAAEGGAATGQDWTRLRGLAVRTDAEAVVVLGLSRDERDVLESMAAELRMVVLDVVIPGGDDGETAREAMSAQDPQELGLLPGHRGR